MQSAVEPKCAYLENLLYNLVTSGILPILQKHVYFIMQSNKSIFLPKIQDINKIEGWETKLWRRTQVRAGQYMY